jgi:hypothetical protein
MKNLFTKEITNEVIDRIEELTLNSQSIWGKMSVSQMLAHCSVTYEMVYTDKHAEPNALTKFDLNYLLRKLWYQRNHMLKTEELLRSF